MSAEIVWTAVPLDDRRVEKARRRERRKGKERNLIVLEERPRVWETSGISGYEVGCGQTREGARRVDTCTIYSGNVLYVRYKWKTRGE